MSIQKSPSVNIGKSNRAVSPGETIPKTPFRIYVTAVNADGVSCKFRISRYSAILNSPNSNDKVPLIGVDLESQLSYKDKVWLEIFYDKNLEPVFSIINIGPKWTDTVVDIADPTKNSPVYPKQLEFISKKDVPRTLTTIENTISRVRTMKEAALTEVLFRNNLGIIDDEAFSVLNSAIETQYARVEELISTYKSSMNKFFESSPTTNWRKLFRTYTLIGYTTKDLSGNLDGTIVTPTISSIPEAEGITQAVDDPSFKIVQCLNNDLLLADICFENRFPARLPMPYSRPVYYYYFDGAEEEVTNTK